MTKLRTLGQLRNRSLATIYVDLGCRVTFCNNIRLVFFYEQRQYGLVKASGMRKQISLMLQKNVIMEVPPDSPGFYSNVFLVRKASGWWRPVIDLKRLNTHIYAPYFHMFTISSVLSTVRKGDYAFKIDRQDAYFHVPIHPSSRKYIRFAFKNKVYQFRVLPFGLNTAPQVFTRLGHNVMCFLHCLGISVIF